MEEEFQESDIIFSGNDCRGNSTYARQHNSRAMHDDKSKKTLPVNIPETISRCVDSDDNPGEDKEMVPPHVIVGQRIARKMALSVCTGNGRTLKGRDLRRVRNSILRMTGFLEA
ncbi:hypothetical protein L6164_035409 [Bauhinia variegata]|uniref:Uncharacterized protein n=1 Tax=Bauhinia variegata TaxID=167791 RepID=A0ACB9KDW2_BAUVA|nr:hypothetical protein L6164_035409 [Bauhinia variegata]